jgi:hypothetical protein
VRDADLILVLDEGEIVEQGAHAELLARGGLYAELFEAQRAGPRPDAPVTLQPDQLAELQELAQRRIRKDDPLEPAIRAARRILEQHGLWQPEQPHLSVLAGGERR